MSSGEAADGVSKDRTGPKLSKSRIESLSDGIYAIAMTLAVLSIDVEGISPPVHEMLLRSMPGVLLELRHYIVSFVALAAFWVNQHALLDPLERTDSGLNWILLSHLLFITLIPVTTAIIGDIRDSSLAVQLFALNVLLIGLTFMLAGSYVRRHRELCGPPDRGCPESSRVCWVTPAISLLVIALAWPLGDSATLLYLLIPLLQLLRRG